jgi:hypothetical protein
MMKKFLKPNFYYASALVLSALSGTFVANATKAYAQSERAAAAPAANSDVTLSSDIMVERVSVDDKGREIVTLKSPKDAVVVPGDKLVIRLHYMNHSKGPVEGFRATNPISNAVEFVTVAEDWAELSVNNGANWGKLSDISVEETDVATRAVLKRSATAKDVTTIRWTFAKPLQPGEKGTVSFRGVIK